MSFNPSGLTVKKAIAKLAGMLDEDLSAVYDAELEGKGRKSLLDAITSARDDIREVVVEEEPVAEVEEEPVVEFVTLERFARMSFPERKQWICVSPDRFEKRG